MQLTGQLIFLQIRIKVILIVFNFLQKISIFIFATLSAPFSRVTDFPLDNDIHIHNIQKSGRVTKSQDHTFAGYDDPSIPLAVPWFVGIKATWEKELN